MNPYFLKLSDVKLFLFLMALVLTPFQDFFLSNTSLGVLGASPAFIPLFCFVLVMGLEVILKIRFVKRYNFLIFVYFFIFLFFTFFYFYELELYGESALVKGGKLFVLYLLLLSPLLYRPKNLPIYAFKTFALVTFVIFIFSYVIVDLLHINISFLNASGKFFNRPSGFYFEPSMFAVGLVMSFITLYVLSNPTMNQLSGRLVVGVLFLCFVVGSKGAIICALIAFMLSRFRKFNLVNLLLFFFGVAITSFILLLNFDLFYLMQSTNTVGTRLSVIFAAILAFFDSPLGFGFSGFLYGLKSNLQLSIDLIDSAFLGLLNLNEVRAYVNSDTSDGLGTKSFFFNGLVIAGIPFVIVYLGFVYNNIKRFRRYSKQNLEFSFWFAILCLTTFIEGYGMYIVTICLNVLIVLCSGEANRSKSNE